MRNVYLSLNVIGGAIVGGLIALVVGFLGLTVIGFVAGGASFVGPALALYLGGYLILYAAPLGLLVGALVTIFRLLRNPIDQIESQARGDNIRTHLASLVWMGLPLLIILGIVAAPYRFMNVDGTTMHGAVWTTEMREDCDSPAVILRLAEYGRSELVCSPELLRYLQSQGDEIVPITYRVIYDFGDPRSYQLVKAGPISLTWDNWLGSDAGCGGEYEPSCDSPPDQRLSPLDESSWPNPE